MPLFTTILAIFILANISVPLTGNFLGEFLVFTGTFQFNPIITLLGALGMILATAYSIWFFNRISFGSNTKYIYKFSDLTQIELNLLSPLVFSILLSEG